MSRTDRMRFYCTETVVVLNRAVLNLTVLNKSFEKAVCYQRVVFSWPVLPFVLLVANIASGKLNGEIKTRPKALPRDPKALS